MGISKVLHIILRQITKEYLFKKMYLYPDFQFIKLTTKPGLNHP